jgi:hypothetical protein
MSESRNILHASPIAVAALAKSYSQKLQLLQQYHPHGDLKTEHETTIAKLKEDCRSLRQQLGFARGTIRFNEWTLAAYQTIRQNKRDMQQMKIASKRAEDRANIAEKKVFELEEEKANLIRKHVNNISSWFL